MKWPTLVFGLVLSVVIGANAEPEQPKESQRQLTERQRAIIRELANPAEFPITGMTASELAGFLKEIESQLGPDKKILSITFWGPAKVRVRTGVSSGPLSGAGEEIMFEKKDGRWTLTRKDHWVS